MKHSKKIKLARTMITREELKRTDEFGERKAKTSIFDSKAWTERKKAIAAKVQRKVEIARKRKEEAKKLKEKK